MIMPLNHPKLRGHSNKAIIVHHLIINSNIILLLNNSISINRSFSRLMKKVIVELCKVIPVKRDNKITLMCSHLSSDREE